MSGYHVSVATLSFLILRLMVVVLVTQLMGDSQNPSEGVQPSDSDDLGVIQETVLQDASATSENPQAGTLFYHLDFLITNISQKYDIDRIQVMLTFI